MDGYRRKTTNPKRAQVWDDSDRIQLLAWLEYCSRHSIDFMDTAIEHLKRSTNAGFSARQIRDKLKRECSKHGNRDRFEHIFSRGLSAFPSLEDQDVSKISDAVEQLDKQLRQNGQSPTSPLKESTTASDISRLFDISQPEIDNFTHISVSPDLPRRSAYGVTSDEPSPQTQMPSRTRIKAPIRLNVAQPAEKGRGGRKRSKRAVVNNSMRQRSQSPVPSTSSNTELDPRLSILQKQLAEKTDIIRAQEQALMKQGSFIWTLQTRLLQTQHQLKQLLECHDAAENHHETTDMHEQLRRQVSLLKQQARDKTQLENDLVAIQTSQLGISFPETVTKFEEIKDFIADASSSVHLLNVHDLASTTGLDMAYNDMADSWARRGTGLALPDLIRHCSNKDISSLRLTEVLAAAGLCDLVFEPIFPALLAIDSPLLDQYRRNILTRYGGIELYLVDSLAHKSLISGGFFRSLPFKERVTQLQDIFSHSLEWLRSPKQDNTERPNTHPESEEDVPAPVAYAFKRPLKAALKLKTELMVPDTYYRLQFFKPGDIFDDDSMNRDGIVPAGPLSKRQRKESGRSGRRPSRSNDRISLCIFPAVYSSTPGMKARSMGDASSLKDCVVDYNYITSAVVTGSQSWILVSKATVLVPEKQSI